jgi:glycosyltransferase involved in cell wall biosynthesis
MGGLLPYGPPFFAMLREQDALLVPSLTDEQPRIVFDAFSQAVPVIAADTTGLRECVTEGKNGRFVPPGNAEALADAIAGASADRESLRTLGISSLDVARNLTHAQMHARRAEAIETALREKQGRQSKPTPQGAATGAGG